MDEKKPSDDAVVEVDKPWTTAPLLHGDGEYKGKVMFAVLFFDAEDPADRSKWSFGDIGKVKFDTYAEMIQCFGMLHEDMKEAPIVGTIYEGGRVELSEAMDEYRFSKGMVEEAKRMKRMLN